MDQLALLVVAIGAVAGLPGCEPVPSWWLSGNEGTDSYSNFLGTAFDRTPLVFRVNARQAWRLIPGGPGGIDAPVVVGGAPENNAVAGVQGGVVVGGGAATLPNTIGDDQGAVLGGVGNRVGDGVGTSLDHGFGVVRGGRETEATGYAATAAGRSCVAGASYSTVLGGWSGEAQAWGGTVGGGGGNAVGADFGVVLGGSGNTTSTGPTSTVLGGVENAVAFESPGCTVPGGSGNQVGGSASSVGGGNANAARDGDDATVRGGTGNEATGFGSVIGGGVGNRMVAEQAELAAGTIAGGRWGLVSSAYGTVGGGDSNEARARWGTVGGGRANEVLALEAATIAGGEANIANGSGTAVLGGEFNEVGNWYGYPSVGATAAGGVENKARGAYTFAAGRQAGMEPIPPLDPIEPGCFLWKDSRDIVQNRWFSCSPANAFRVGAAGGIRLLYGPEGSRQAVLEAGSGDWSFGSTERIVESRVRVHDRDALRKLISLPVSSWRYRHEPAQTRHMGPMAQEFGQMFGVGSEPGRIGGLDADGATLAAIRGLLEEVEAMERILGEERKGTGTTARTPQTAGVTLGGSDGDGLELGGWLLAGAAAGFGVGGLGRRRGRGRRASVRCRQGRLAVLFVLACAAWLVPASVSAQVCWTTSGNPLTDPTVNYVGTSDNQAFVVRTYGRIGFRLEPGGMDGLGTPNVVGGRDKNVVDFGIQGGAICGGGTVDTPNIVRDSYGAVGGGAGNLVGDGAGTETGQYATVCGGRGNSAPATGAAICGGEGNDADGPDATVGGGFGNLAGAQGAVVAGGVGNSADDDYATVCGGYSNQALSQHSTVGGGQNNAAYGGPFATVCGGYHNWASAEAATVCGGAENYALTYGSTVGGGTGNQAGASGGAGATVGGGINNWAAGAHSTVAGGEACQALGDYATVGGGQANLAETARSTVGGGMSNRAFGEYATVAGGQMNQAGGQGSTVCGGERNQASADYSTVPGGTDNVAGGWYSFAAGRRANAVHHGCFVWGDSTDADVACEAADQFVARASGGFYFYTSPDLSTGVWLPPDGSDWLRLSDRESKRDIEPVDPEEVLRKLREVPIYTWSYAGQAGDVRHMGPLAQDFHAAFGLGSDERYLGTLDADGVAMAALQGLARRVERLRTELESLRTGRDGSVEASLGGPDSRPGKLWAWLCGFGFVAGIVIRRAGRRRLAPEAAASDDEGDGPSSPAC